MAIDGNILRASYIGDSGYIVLRPRKKGFALVFESQEQQHSFNYPFQVGNPGDDPTSALEFVHEDI
jgi:protein phosphatase PTC7